MIVADTSVLVAAFASWHEHHAAAGAAAARGLRLAAHSALETYSVLTRLPAPHRAPAPLVARYLREQFPEEPLVLDAAGHRTLLDRLADLNLGGGAVYDALIAFTAAGAGATLLSCDRRALRTYERCGVVVETIA